MMQSLEEMRAAGLQPIQQSPQSYLLSNPAPPQGTSSPPFLRVATGSDCGSHDFDDGDHLGTTGTSNSPPPHGATFQAGGAGSGGNSGSATAAAPKPKRKRSMIACKNCNERRVRCDGATHGLPCSNCKHAGKGDCQFIESKRVRGARGRFESRDGISGSANSPTAAISSKRPFTPSEGMPGGAPRKVRRHSITGTDNEEWRRLLQNSASINRATTGPVTYLGESWHLSWVVQEQMKHSSDTKPLHLPTLMMQDDGDVYNRVNKELWEKGAYVLPRHEVRDLLIAQYFEVCHPTYPILCKANFLNSLQTNTFSHLLVQAVLMVSATHCDWAVLSSAGFVSRRAAVDGFYKRCRALWDGDVEPDKITNIQTMFLMQFWWRAVIDHKDPLWWLSGAIRMAQTMGLHRSAEKSRLNQRDKRNWRRMWWLLFLRDRQAASHFGKPMMINEKDCDVEDLQLEDLEGEVDRVQAMSLLEHIKLAKLVGAIVECEFCPGAAKDPNQRRALRIGCHARLSEWQGNLPEELVYQPNSNNLSAMCLQIALFAQLLLLNRPATYTDATVPEEIREPSEKIAGQAADCISKIADELIKTWGARYMSQHSMSCLFAAMTVQMIKRKTHKDPRGREDADMKLRQNMTHLIQLDKILPMAGWIHRRYARILEQEDDTDDARNASISPPAALVANSIGAPMMLPSHRTPPPQQMHTIAEEAETEHEETHGNQVGLKQEEVDEWGNADCAQILNMEHALTDPDVTRQMENGNDGTGFPKQQMNYDMEQHQRDAFADIMPDQGMGVSIIQPDLSDYHWFMDNIGNMQNPYWWSQIQGK
ncbi:fungal-specific transcription factor domain-containing protein [Pyronema domesticum]|nr:fungal-specific transcription factor domain-containing protein [Pyronema domesticum]